MIRHSVCLFGTVAIATVLLVAGCRSDAQQPAEISADVSFSPSPPRVGAADVVLTAKDAAGQPLSARTLEVEGNMNHAGMKPVFTTLEATSPGRYEGTLEFTMGGDWFLIVTGTLDDGRPVNAKIDVPGVQRP